jgi:transposase-like protein
MIRCPVCRSTEIYRLVGGYIGEIYRCKRCGYSGSLVIEEDEEHEEKPEG